MEPQIGLGQLPGISDEQTMESRKFLKDTGHIVVRGVKIDKDTDDVAHVGKESVLRGGLALVRVEAGPLTGKYVDAGHASAPVAGDIESAVILMETMPLADVAATRQDKAGSGLIHGFVEEDQILWGTSDAPTIAAIKAVLPMVQFES